MTDQSKTRAERIEEAAQSIMHRVRSVESQTIQGLWCIPEHLLARLREALALPPDPPADAKLRELRDICMQSWSELIEAKKKHSPGSEARAITQAQANDLQGLIGHIDRLLAAAPKEPEPEPAESPVPAINMSGSGELSFDWWCGERNLTVFGENVTFLASHNAEPHDMIDGKVADLDHLRELQKWVADGGVVPQRGPQLDESPAEPAQDNSYRSLDHACEILRGCVAPYSGEQAQKVAKVLKQWRDKWAAAVDCIHPDERQTIADLRAKLAEADTIFSWLLGEVGDFPAREAGEGQFYWRKELRKRIAEMGGA